MTTEREALDEALAELPDDIRVPLHRIWADAGYLIARAKNGDTDLAIHTIKALCDEVERAVRAALAKIDAAQAAVPVAPMSVIEVMVTAYLTANDAYWREVDAMPTKLGKWRAGTPSEATRVSLQAALAAARPTPQEPTAQASQNFAEWAKWRGVDPHTREYGAYAEVWEASRQATAHASPAQVGTLTKAELLVGEMVAATLNEEREDEGDARALDAAADRFIRAKGALLRALATTAQASPAAPILDIPKERLALNVRHSDCHKAADAFWAYWNEYGETHKHGYYESTWGAINRALRTVGVVEHEHMKATAEAIACAAAPQPSPAEAQGAGGSTQTGAQGSTKTE
jgi:hypothetical protein